jgi:putative toxin-antitoxin system antitoxin component (TIGR02293 family)
MHTIEFVPSGTRLLHDRYLHELSEFLSSDVRSGADLATLAAGRLPVETLDRLLRAGLVWDELAFIVPRRTLSHRKDKGEALTVEESDKAIRLARILAQANSIFGEPKRALHWLRTKQQRLAEGSPLELAGTEQGAHLVEEQLLQIDEGYFA